MCPKWKVGHFEQFGQQFGCQSAAKFLNFTSSFVVGLAFFCSFPHPSFSPFLLLLPSPPSFSFFLLPLLPFLPHPSHSLSYLTASSMDPGNVRVAVRVRKVLDHEQDDELCLTNTDKAIDLFNYKSPTDTLKFK